jgi:hypothetical protein
MDQDEHNVSLIENFIAAAAEAVPLATSPSVISKDQEIQDDDKKEETKQSDDCATRTYQARTFRPGSNSGQRRSGILPAYPLAKNDSHHRIILLLSNVADVNRDKCEQESYCGGYGVCPFEFKQHRFVEPIDSFMMDLYRDLFIEPSQQWKIHYSIIDYNLSRLQQCMQLYTKQTNQPALLSFKELPIALEFFLQIDGK